MKHSSIYSLAAAIVFATGAISCSTMRTAKARVQETWTSITKSDSRKEAAHVETKVSSGELPTADLSALQTEAMINRIMFGKWDVLTVGGKRVTGSERPYVVFDSTATNPFILKFYANNGCNTINGMVALTRGNEMAKVGDYASTMRLCPDAPYENGVSSALENVKKYRLDVLGEGDYQMSFLDRSGKTMMVLSKNDMSFVEGAWAVTNIGQIEVKPDDLPSPMMLVIDMIEHKLHGSTGCNVLNGNIVVDPDVRNSITFTDVSTTRMGCPNAGLEQQLTAALARVVRAEQGKKADIVLLLDQAGNTVIRLKHTDLSLDN